MEAPQTTPDKLVSVSIISKNFADDWYRKVSKDSRHLIDELRKGVEIVKNMTPEERETMEKAQRKSWTEQEND